MCHEPGEDIAAADGPDTASSLPVGLFQTMMEVGIFLFEKLPTTKHSRCTMPKVGKKLDRSWQSDSSLAKVQPMNEWRGRNNTLGCRHNTVFITIQLLLCEVRVDGCVVSLHVGLRILSGVPSWKIVSSQLAITCEKLTIIQFLETARKNVRMVHAVP